MPLEDPQSVVDEFGKAIEDFALGLSFTGISLDKLLEWLAAQPREPENPDPRVYVGPDPPGQSTSFILGAWRFSEIRAACAADGQVRKQLGQQWLVTTHALWEEEYRARIAATLGGAKNDLGNSLFGDINKMRNDIVHHRGIASRGKSGRCEVLRWFEDGDVMNITSRHIDEFIGRFRTLPFQLSTSPPAK